MTSYFLISMLHFASNFCKKLIVMKSSYMVGLSKLTRGFGALQLRGEFLLSLLLRTRCKRCATFIYFRFLRFTGYQSQLRNYGPAGPAQGARWGKNVIILHVGY